MTSCLKEVPELNSGLCFWKPYCKKSENQNIALARVEGCRVVHETKMLYSVDVAFSCDFAIGEASR